MPQTSGEVESQLEEPRGPFTIDSPERAASATPERLSRTRAAHRGYYRWLRLSRLMLGAFVIAGFVVLGWLIPWLPSGLEPADYTPKLAFTVYLLGFATIIGMLALGFRELARRDRESLLVWSSVYDEATGLHNRTYLYDRLSLECERSQRIGSVFSVIVLQIRIVSPKAGQAPALSAASHEKLAELIDGLTHPTDVVALLSGSELAILTIGAGRDSRTQIQERLRNAVQAELPKVVDGPSVIDVRGGMATYGVDGTDAGTLIKAARMSAMLTAPPRARAA